MQQRFIFCKNYFIPTMFEIICQAVFSKNEDPQKFFPGQLNGNLDLVQIAVYGGPKKDRPIRSLWDSLLSESQSILFIHSFLGVIVQAVPSTTT